MFNLMKTTKNTDRNEGSADLELNDLSVAFDVGSLGIFTRCFKSNAFIVKYPILFGVNPEKPYVVKYAEDKLLDFMTVWKDTGSIIEGVSVIPFSAFRSANITRTPKKVCLRWAL